jgi:uracil-DNA glycosylase family 4
MEQQFKKYLNQLRLTNNPLMRTFEGSLFKETRWFLDSETDSVQIEGIAAAPLVKKAIPAVVIEENHKGLPPLCEVLFVGDSYNGEGEDLLGRMISAMKLSTKEFYRFPMNEALENISDLAGNVENPESATRELYQFILEKRPKIVVSLGATVTNILLGKREKLSGIHGQFFEKNIGECHFNLMPVFHPDFLVINPNMKRTAWIDLQKVMERVGKI